MTEVLGDGAVGVTSAVLGLLADAATQEGRVRFRYTDAGGRGSQRLVDPLRLVGRGGRWYLVGDDVDRDAWRLFRVDRVRAVEAVPGTYPRRRPFDTAVAEWFATELGRAPGGPARRATDPAAQVPARELSAPEPVRLLLLGGRSGVGKTSVAHEVSRLLVAGGTAHGVVDGDALGHVHPLPPDDPHGTALTDASLRALWRVWAAASCSRVLYVNTVSVLEADRLAVAVGAGDVRSVLLTASDGTVAERLARRESGEGLADHLRRSSEAARHLGATAPETVTRVPTDGRSVPEVARDVVTASGWLDDRSAAAP